MSVQDSCIGKETLDSGKITEMTGGLQILKSVTTERNYGRLSVLKCRKCVTVHRECYQKIYSKRGRNCKLQYNNYTIIPVLKKIRYNPPKKR